MRTGARFGGGVGGGGARWKKEAVPKCSVEEKKRSKEGGERDGARGDEKGSVKMRFW